MVMRKSDGFALIDILFACGIMSVLCTIALPNMLLARQSAASASAAGSLRAISSAQLTFALTCGGGFYAPNLTTLGTAPAASREGFISPDLGMSDTVSKSGYLIQLEATAFPGAPGSCNGLGAGEGGRGFKAGADPLDGVNTRFFATNANLQIFEHTSTLFSTMPETGQPSAGHVLQ
jgi:type II secretory pathway pseudopilin PulG